LLSLSPAQGGNELQHLQGPFKTKQSFFFSSFSETRLFYVQTLHISFQDFILSFNTVGELFTIQLCYSEVNFFLYADKRAHKSLLQTEGGKVNSMA